MNLHKVNELLFERKKEKLYEIYTHATRTVPYYRDVLKLPFIEKQNFTYEEFCKHVPLLEKKEVNRNAEIFISSEYGKDSLFVESTSGTEGKPTFCYRDEKNKSLSASALWKKRRRFVKNLKPSDPFARFYAMRRLGEDSLIVDKVLFKGNDIHIPLNNMSSDKIAEYWDEILKFKPKWMHGPATAIFNIAQYVLSNNLPVSSLELVELNGEFVSDEHIELIQRAFNCQVANHYGSREFWGIGFSCPKNKLHLMDSTVFVENITNENGKNEIAVTSIGNQAWPLLRYKLGDLGTLTYEKKCSCGQKESFVLTIERGRKADYFTLDGGLLVNAVLFSGLSRGLNQTFNENCLYQYQIIKHSGTALEIKMVINQDMAISCEKFLETYDKELRKVVPPTVTVDYVLVEHIAHCSRTGKVRDFIDNS